MNSPASDPRISRFPLGAAITAARLDADPYPMLALVREQEPISWVPSLGMWLVTGYEDVSRLLLDTERLTTASPRSPIVDTFGQNMLTTEGTDHSRYRRALQPSFMKPYIAEHLLAEIAASADELLAALGDAAEIDIRHAFAARLPVQVILATFGLPAGAEPLVRRWYDAFELGLANYEGDPIIRAAAKASAEEFRAYLQNAVHASRGNGTTTLLGRLTAEGGCDLSVTEVIQNMLIVLFGGISTVEALLLNAVWALGHRPEMLKLVREDRSLVGNVIEETMRWLSPVQSATRYAVCDQEILGVEVRAGDMLICSLAGANHDPRMFENPTRFDIRRPNSRRHLGFAIGPHLCLGFRLAKAEAEVGINRIIDRFPDLAIVAERSSPPTGYEFRQPRSLWLKARG